MYLPALVYACSMLVNKKGQNGGRERRGTAKATNRATNSPLADTQLFLFVSSRSCALHTPPFISLFVLPLRRDFSIPRLAPSHSHPSTSASPCLPFSTFFVPEDLISRSLSDFPLLSRNHERVSSGP